MLLCGGGASDFIRQRPKRGFDGWAAAAEAAIAPMRQIIGIRIDSGYATPVHIATGALS